MKISKHLLMLFLIQLFLVGCETDLSYLKKLEDSELVQANVKNLTDIIVYDIFSPPVASRVYLYPAIAAYQTMQLANQENYASLSGQVKGLSPLPKPSSEKVNYNIASLHAFNVVGKALIFSEDKMTLFQENLDQDLKERGVPGSVLKASKKYGEVVADHILAWAKGDLYNQTRTYPKY
ncbi:MAG: phosphatidic acid phosphatase, partial [Flavobacteriales bacterium]